MIAWMPGIALRLADEDPASATVVAWCTGHRLQVSSSKPGGYLAAIHAQSDLTAVSKLGEVYSETPRGLECYTFRGK